MIFFVFNAESQAQVYKYVDKKGGTHFTNVPADSRYRFYIAAEPEKPESSPYPANTINGPNALPPPIAINAPNQPPSLPPPVETGDRFNSSSGINTDTGDYHIQSGSGSKNTPTVAGGSVNQNTAASHGNTGGGFINNQTGQSTPKPIPPSLLK